MQIPSEVLLWKFGGKEGNLTAINNYQSNQGYNLLCAANNKYLSWVPNQASVNLGYISDASERKVHFKLPDGTEREIVTGDPVAFGLGGGEAFLYYGHQTVGINLKWSKDAAGKDEWRIFGASGQPGEPITMGMPYALLNVKVQPTPDFLIFLEQKIPRVVDLGWTTSPQWLNKFVEGAKMAKEAATFLAQL